VPLVDGVEGSIFVAVTAAHLRRANQCDQPLGESKEESCESVDVERYCIEDRTRDQSPSLGQRSL
jgi:hypothetical protein